MPPVPSLSTAFSNLFKASAPSIGAMSMSTPATAKPIASIVPQTKTVAPVLSTPAVPSLTSGSFGMQTSTPATLGAKANFGASTPSIPSLSLFGGTSTATPNSSASKVTAPVVPQTQAKQPQYFTTPSGLVIDPATGSVVGGSQNNQAVQSSALPTPQTQDLSANTGGVTLGDNTGNSGAAFNYSASAGGPALPSIGGGTTSYDPRITSSAAEDAYKKYQDSLTMSPEEIDAQTKLNALNASAAQAYSNTEGQAIPLEFITGQKAALQRSQSALSVPLESQLSLAQAKRQMAMTASKAALDREDAKVSAYRSINAPTSVAIGSTLVNPSTGQSVFGGGSADILGKAIAEGRLTPDQVTRYGQTAIISALQQDPGYNFVTQKASVASDSASLKTQQSYADTVSRSFSTAQDNLKNIINFMTTSGINTGSTIPFINELTNKVKAGVTDAGTIAAFNSALSGLRAEYAQVLSRGGEVTDNARNSAAALIPDNITPAQLQQVAQQLNNEGANAIKEANAKVAEVKGRVGGNTGKSNTPTGAVVQTKAGPISTDW